MLLLILVAFVCAYLYFVGATVLNVIARKEAIAQTATLASSVADLERSYFTDSKGITPSSGARLGLAPVAESSYIHRPGATAVATMRNAL